MKDVLGKVLKDWDIVFIVDHNGMLVKGYVTLPSKTLMIVHQIDIPINILYRGDAKDVLYADASQITEEEFNYVQGLRE